MRLFIILSVFSLILSCSKAKKPIAIEEVKLDGTTTMDYPGKLSEWGLFEEPQNLLRPADNILPYDLNTPLFSDYAHKARFVKFPMGASATYDPVEVVSFPEETILIKNFYYPVDFGKPAGDRRILETRLLIFENDLWEAITYVWNDEQTEAFLEIAGTTIPVSWTDETGVLKEIDYSVPNLVQCKSCHEKSGKMSPIGPVARQLNRNFNYDEGAENQLLKWKSLGYLAEVPPMNEWPKVPTWENTEDGTLAQRARAWLEVNCAHCHRAEGPAKNTGMYLTYQEEDPYKLGIKKPPVAAGRGSGGLKYGIVPGNPDESILVHRISSLDPGVMMPELGRRLRHEEGVELVRRWIKEMD